MIKVKVRWWFPAWLVGWKVGHAIKKDTNEENKTLRELLTETWRLMDRATLIFGHENNKEYYDAWDRYRELEKQCEPYLNSMFENGPKDAIKTEPCHNCKKPRQIVEFGALICPRPHCGDETPF